MPGPGPARRPVSGAALWRAGGGPAGCFTLIDAMEAVRIAILDMYARAPNEGMRCIRQLLARGAAEHGQPFQVDTFDVRAGNAVPGLDYDVYISSGGPGSPLVSGEAWEPRYFAFVDALLAHNARHDDKKHLLLICHSYQLVSRHLGVGDVTRRKSTSFGVLPVHRTAAGLAEPVLHGLSDPFYIVDSRDYQLVNLDHDRLAALGAAVLCLEKERPHVPLSRAAMAIRFTPEVLGTQFHPEADGEGMLRHLRTPERRQQVIADFGAAKYEEMMRLLADPAAIARTESVIVPTFLRRALAAVRPLMPA